MREADDHLSCADRSDATTISQARDEIVNDYPELAAVALQRVSALADRNSQAAQLAVTHGIGAIGADTTSPPGHRSQYGAVESATSNSAVGVIPAQQQGPQPVGLRGMAPDEVLAGAEQDSKRFTVAVRAWGRDPVRVTTQRGEHGQVRVDGVGLAAPATGRAVGVRTR
ncbi:hypothetical protein [Pseudonocardia dioxanivorans]|uniref:hypothetical protein n=1 Tax=Pseudonocardia dioxanivorans TaxID=240495 RepID=UPI0005A15CDB|nr:hypothetical protein [Pseudonocardia dioxanivorans]